MIGGMDLNSISSHHVCSVEGADKPFSGTNPACAASIAHAMGLRNSFNCAAARMDAMATKGVTTTKGVISLNPWQVVLPAALRPLDELCARLK